MSSSYDEISEAWKNDIEYLRLVGELSGLSVALWRTGQPAAAERWTSCSGEAHPCFLHEPLRLALEGYCRERRPSIYFEDNHIIYGIMPIGSFSLAFGPAAVFSASEAFEQSYAVSHGLSTRMTIPRMDLGVLTRFMELAHIHFTGTAISREEIHVTADILETWQRSGELEEYQLEQSENDRGHQTGIDFENALLVAVQNGDPDRLKKLMSGSTPDFREIGSFSEKQNKENEYLTVSVITLMTRAAVAGGAPAEAAHELGDVYLKRLAEAALRREPFMGLSFNCMLEFAELVRRAREEKSKLSYVDACKQYIEKNLRKNLQVGDIAPAIGLSRTYLSRLFHQAEGITVQQYIQKEKCRHAAQMLQYTDYSISQIALYFSFSSQSYFGSCFQTWYGMTPNAYRKAHH